MNFLLALPKCIVIYYIIEHELAQFPLYLIIAQYIYTWLFASEAIYMQQLIGWMTSLPPAQSN